MDLPAEKLPSRDLKITSLGPRIFTPLEGCVHVQCRYLVFYVVESSLKFFLKCLLCKLCLLNTDYCTVHVLKVFAHFGHTVWP